MSRGPSYHIPGLDGLRALAVLAVIFYHLFPLALPGGYIGVDIFFVISGFLITTLLITEHVRTGAVSLPQFWLRRARRLLPTLFVTILVIGSAVFFIRGDAIVGIGQQLLGASTFSSNWMEIVIGTDYFGTTSSHLFMNFWSLAVEEQFYLLWPFAVLVLIGVIKKPRIGIIITGLAALASAGLMAYLFYRGASASRVYYGTDTHLFGLMIGASLAFWSRVQTTHQPLRRLTQPFWNIRRHSLVAELMGAGALTILLVLTATLSDQSPAAYSGGLLLASLATAVLLVVVVGKKGALQNLFTIKLLEWIGSRSYGLYLWHWPLIVLLRQLMPDPSHTWLLPVGAVLLTFGIAELSYRYLEVPIRQHGFKVFLKKAIKRGHTTLDNASMRTYMRPHSITLIVLLALGFTTAAVISAPTKTSAQLSIEKGQNAIREHAAESKRVVTVNPTKKVPLEGPYMVAIGDSVTLASTPYLQETFPGILINAEISRSIRRGGLETVSHLQNTGELRDIVIVALGTNGYFGSGNLDQLISQLGNRKIILVTAHADREWTVPNNNDMVTATKQYNNVAIAEWDSAISAHPDYLSDDGIHPTKEGEVIYANCITQAYRKFK